MSWLSSFLFNNNKGSSRRTNRIGAGTSSIRDVEAKSVEVAVHAAFQTILAKYLPVDAILPSEPEIDAEIAKQLGVTP